MVRTAQDPKEHHYCGHLDTLEPEYEKVRQNKSGIQNLLAWEQHAGSSGVTPLS